MVSDNIHRAANAVEKHKKSWGHEEWIVNNEQYCGKRLVFTKAGGHTSLHFHREKHETMLCLRGHFAVTVVNTRDGAERQFDLYPGDQITIEQFTVHRIKALLADSELIEFSTHHSDDDSYRVQR